MAAPNQLVRAHHFLHRVALWWKRRTVPRLSIHVSERHHMFQFNARRHGLRTLAVAAALFSAHSLTFGADRQWRVSSGSFDVALNWSPAAAPVAGDRAVIDVGTSTYSSGTRDIASLDVGPAVTGNGTFEMLGGTLRPTEAHFGKIGQGSGSISGGTLTIGTGGLFIGGELQAGFGIGTVTISGASARVSSDDIVLGRLGTGTLTMSAGRLAGDTTVVGKFGTGAWNHSGGVFDQQSGDIEIGDGGTPAEVSVGGARSGMINLMGGVIHSAGDFGIGNRRGTGTVNITGGALDVTGDTTGTGTIFVGRGLDWAGHPGAGGPATLHVTGGAARIVANGGFSMNPDNVASSSTLVAEITGTAHTTIRVAGNANIANGRLKVELNGFTPVSGNSWTLIEAGATLTADLNAIDALVAGGGYPALNHEPRALVGNRIGTFLSTDFSAAPLAQGLSWDVAYIDKSVVLRVIGSALQPADFNRDGSVDRDDLAEWRADVGKNAGSNADGDNDSDGNDFLAWQRQLTPGATPTVSGVPEPAAAMLVLAALLGLAGLSRARHA